MFFLLVYYHLLNEDLIIFIRCDVGLVDVVIFDCYLQLIVYYTRLCSFLCTSNCFLWFYEYLSNLFDPGRSYCYWDSIKPCKSNEFIFMAYGSVTRG